jgi:hypothetical protein
MGLITDLAEKSFRGDRAAFMSFLRSFVRTDLIVPDSNQPFPLSGQASPPSPFFPFLAFNEDDQTLIPCFEEDAQIGSWSGTSLTFRRIPSTQLLQLVPDTWGLIFNPGSDIEKIFTPWEIGLLRDGSESSFEEIASELFDPPPEEFLSISPVSSLEYPQLLETFIDFCSAQVSVCEGWILEVVTPSEELEKSEIFAGVSLSRENSAVTPMTEPIALRKQLSDTLGPSMIGRGTLRVTIMNETKENLIDSLLRAHPPVYSRKNRVAG